MSEHETPADARPRPSVRLSLATRLSLTTKMALGFFSITLLAIAALYLYVAPGLQNRLMASKLSDLRNTARVHAASLSSTVGSATSLPTVRKLVMATSESTGNRVTLLSVNRVDGRPELSMQMDSSMSSHTPVRLSLANRAVLTRRIITGTDRTPTGLVAQAADPVVLGGRVAAVIVFTSSVADVLRTVSTVRHEILVAGGLALLVALIAGVLIARALTQRVRRLDLAAQRVAAGTFGDPIPVESGDELGQLAVSFNEMQSQLLALEEARKRFIATASHELRTPIFSLGGFVELLEDDDLDPETRRRFLDQIRDQVRRLGKLSVDLLDLSRLESGSLDLRPEEVDLGELTRSVAGEFEPTLAQHDARLQVCLTAEAEHLEASCDPRPRRADSPHPDRQRPHPHSRGDGDLRVGERKRARHRAGGPRRRRGDRPRRGEPYLRAVLHLRRRAGLGARAGDRLRARRPDAGAVVGRLRGRGDDVHAAAAGDRAARGRGPLTPAAAGQSPASRWAASSA